MRFALVVVGFVYYFARYKNDIPRLHSVKAVVDKVVAMPLLQIIYLKGSMVVLSAVATRFIDGFVIVIGIIACRF